MSREKDFEDRLAKDTAKREESRLLAMSRKVIEEQEKTIAALRAKRFSLPKSAPAKRQKGSFLRVIAADMHGASMDPGAVKAFLGDLGILHPQECILLGDIVDCGGFLAEHHVMGYVAETEYTYQDDCDKGNAFLDAVQGECAETTYIMGNHERRVEKWCVEIGLKARTDRRAIMHALIREFDPQFKLSLDQRGVTVIRQGVTQPGTFTPATLRRGKSLYVHTGFERGGGSGPTAAKRHLEKFGTNIAYAHDHKQVVYPGNIAGTGETIVARNPGCLCQRQPLWQHGDPTGWTHGYLIELVNPDGTFLCLPIPIVDGVSILGGLADKLQ